MTDENVNEKVEAHSDSPKKERRPKKGMGNNKDKKSHNGNNNGKDQPVVELEERVVVVNRVAKVVKGGRRFSFSALIVVGDKRGNVGFGLGKAKEVPEAIRKANSSAQRKLFKIPIQNGTIPHETIGEHDAAKILFKPASEGTGIKAAGACRSILELAGVKNVLTKSLKGTNPHNVVKATFKALRSLRSVEAIASARNKEAKEVRVK